MYRRSRSQRVRQYTYERSQYPELCKAVKRDQHKEWEPIIPVSKLEETGKMEKDIFDNKASLEVEELINSLEERNEKYKWEDSMSYGVNRMNEWDRGYYEGNPYIYGWECAKMCDFTEELGGDVDDELD